MDLRHHFRQLKLITESSAFAFQFREAIPFLNNGQIHPPYHHLQATTFRWFYNVFLGQLRPGVKYPFNYSFPGRKFNISTFNKLMNIFTKPLIVQFDHLVLNGLFISASSAWICFVHPLGIIILSTFISFKSFLTLSVKWHFEES